MSKAYPTVKTGKRGYIAKAVVYLHIDTDYADGVGEAQREVRWIIEQCIKVKGVKLAHAARIRLPDGQLIRKMTECDWSLTHVMPDGRKIVVDSGER